MWFDDFSKENCKNCYACVRVCPVDAIEIKNEQARIIEQRCIVCGECSTVCPQSYTVVFSEVKKVKQMIKENDNIVASVAPSFPAIFGDNSDKLPSVLKYLGFKYVEETLVGAKPIIEEYYKYMNKEDNENYITSLCPTVVNLIEKHHPDLIKNLIPSISASTCHAKILKKKYGPKTKVVFIGPCLGKKDEGKNESCIDSVITFEELKKWLKEEKICWDSFDGSNFDVISHYKSVYPFFSENKDILYSKQTKKKLVPIDGIEDCLQILNAIKNNRIHNTFLEMNFCRNSCIRGTGIKHLNTSAYERRMKVKKYSDKHKAQFENEEEHSYDEIFKEVNLNRKFESKYMHLKEPTEEDFKEILGTIGIFSKNDEINCRACGYDSCRDKAKAIFNGLADDSMCIPYLRKKAENKANVIFTITPNLIGIINNDLCIEEFNPTALKFFKTSNSQIKNIPIDKFFDEEKFKQVKESKKNIIKERAVLKNPKAIIIQDIIWIQEDQLFIWIADDITEEEKKKEEIQFMKMDAIDMAQDVINKQMKVAQEIASLLGETTADTKVTLTRLKELVEEEGK